jgi:hypothetical protein
MTVSCQFRKVGGGNLNLSLGGGTQFLECRAFQTAEVAFAGRRLLKDMLCHFKRA